MAQQTQTAPRPAPSLEVITGEVAAVNDYGINVLDRWFNFSKFVPVERPEEGQYVRLEIKSGKWISRLDLLSSGELDEAAGALPFPDPLPQPQQSTPPDDGAPLLTSTSEPPTLAPALPPARSRVSAPTVTSDATLRLRSAALTAALTYSMGGDVQDIESVLKLADRIAQWLEGSKRDG